MKSHRKYHRFSPSLFSRSQIIAANFAGILWPTYKCDELSARPLLISSQVSRVDRRPSDVRACTFQCARGACGSHLAPGDSLSFHVRVSWRSRRICISGYISINRVESVISCCMTGNLVENRKICAITSIVFGSQKISAFIWTIIFVKIAQVYQNLTASKCNNNMIR